MRESIKKTFKNFTLLLLAGAVVFFAVGLGLSAKYDLPFAYVADKFMRYGALTVIDIATDLYDPVMTRHAVVSPDYRLNDISFRDYVRIEDYLERHKENIRLRGKEVANEKIIRSEFAFSYQPYGEPRLAELREKYDLDEVVASARDEFDAMFLLLKWTRSRFRRQDYQPYMTNFDALAVLDRDLRNDRNEAFDATVCYDPCYFFPLLYGQVLLSMGYQPRLVHITDNGYVGHGMVEVWSNQFRKWISMDAELALYYEKDGVPLNLLEVHNERYEKKPSKVRIIRGEQHSGDINTTMVFLKKEKLDIEWMIDYHSYFRIMDMRNDWMTNHYFRGHPARSDFSRLTFIDHKMPPIFDLAPATDNKDDFYWTLNQTEIMVREGGEPADHLAVAFKTFTPNFKHFRIEIDRSGETVAASPLFTWDLHAGENEMTVRSVNKYGIEGIPSSVRVFVETEKNDQ